MISIKQNKALAISSYIKKIPDQFFSKNVLLAACLFAIFVYFLPYIILGENFHLMIHDNLDSNVVWAKLYLETGNYFSTNMPIEQLMNGNSKVSSCVYNDISLSFFKLFGMYWGYVINKIVMSLVGFFGMKLLLENYFIPGKNNLFIQYGVALIFALLPFWSFTLSIAGMPLLLYAFLNIRQGQNKVSNWIIIAVMGFYSYLIFSGFFFMSVVFILFIYDFIRAKKINIKFFMALAMLTICYIISHFNLFSSFLVKSDYVSQRVEFEKDPISFMESWKASKDIFLKGQYHTHSLQFFIIPAILICLFLMWKYKERNRVFVLLFSFIILTSLFYGFIYWGPVNTIFAKIALVIPIQFQRFHSLHALFWYILFAMSLAMIYNKLKFGNYIVILLLALQFNFVVKYHEYIVHKNEPSFKEFYSQDIFNDIKTYIGKDPSTYRVISLGMHPAVAQYNGFYTLDAYIADYSLSYKKDFRKIIAGELAKDKVLENYFDHWGSRCYAFSSELDKSFMISKRDAKEIGTLSYDVDAFKQMGGRYMLSTVKIDTALNTRFILKETFEKKNSFWKIYLYETV